jgi:flagellin-like hook-associated protein FlgL
VGLSGVVDIAAEGYFYSVAAKNDGSVVGWGGLSSDPVTVLAPAGAGIVAVAAGNWHTIGLRSNGSVVFLHGGSFVPPEALSGVVAIAAGDVYSMALKNDGSVIAWGDNTYGQVDVPSGLSGVVAIAAGGTYSLALKNDGSLVGWGNVSVPADALTGNMVPTYSDFKLSPNDILTGMTVISGGPNVYIAGVLATSGMYSISGITITLTTPIGLATPVTYDYNPGFTSTSTSPVTKKTTAFTLGTTLTTGQYITDVFINNSQIPVSGYSVSGVSIDFTSSYAPLSGQIVTANVYNPSAQSGAIGSYYSVFQLATNDVLSGMSVISGGPSVYVSGELAAIGTYSIAGNKITLTTPVGQNTPVTYDYNSGYTITSTSPVTTKATSFTLGSTLTTGQYITDLFINNSKIPASRYSVSGLSINFVPDYAPASGQVVTASVYHPATTGSWQTESGLDLATDQLATAINTLRNHSAALASNMSTVTVREDFTNSMIQTLLKGADNLTLADMDEEGANMLMLQTRQQLGTTSLQMASKAAQGVQRLFE